MVDGPGLSLDQSVQMIRRPTRVVTDEFHQSIPNREKSDLRTPILFFDDLGTFKPEPFKFLDPAIKVLHNDSDMVQFLQQGLFPPFHRNQSLCIKAKSLALHLSPAKRCNSVP